LSALNVLIHTKEGKEEKKEGGGKRKEGKKGGKTRRGIVWPKVIVSDTIALFSFWRCLILPKRLDRVAEEEKGGKRKGGGREKRRKGASRCGDVS